MHDERGTGFGMRYASYMVEGAGMRCRHHYGEEDDMIALIAAMAESERASRYEDPDTHEPRICG